MRHERSGEANKFVLIKSMVAALIELLVALGSGVVYAIDSLHLREDGGHMRQERIICDECKLEKPCKYIFSNHRRVQSASGSMEDDCDTNELCFDCSAIRLNQLLKKVRNS